MFVCYSWIKPHIIILVAYPTGSGTFKTYYRAIRSVHRTERVRDMLHKNPVSLSLCYMYTQNIIFYIYQIYALIHFSSLFLHLFISDLPIQNYDTAQNMPWSDYGCIFSNLYSFPWELSHIKLFYVSEPSSVFLLMFIFKFLFCWKFSSAIK